MPSPAERLDVLYEVNRRLATFSDLDGLLEYATRRAREIFEAEGCALLLVDRARGEFCFPQASQSASSHASPARLHEIRFPSDQGIAGWVLVNDRAVAIDDVQHDPRFYPGVDAATGSTTRAMLCAPLRSSDGPIGVITVLNPANPTSEGDLPFLEALGSDVAVAHEKAALHERLRREVVGLRQLSRIAGIVLVALGLAVIGATTFARLARALPLGDLVREPVVLLGGVMVVAGAVLARSVQRTPSVP